MRRDVCILHIPVRVKFRDTMENAGQNKQTINTEYCGEAEVHVEPSYSND